MVCTKNKSISIICDAHNRTGVHFYIMHCRAGNAVQRLPLKFTAVVPRSFWRTWECKSRLGGQNRCSYGVLANKNISVCLHICSHGLTIYKKVALSRTSLRTDRDYVAHYGTDNMPCFLLSYRTTIMPCRAVLNDTTHTALKIVIRRPADRTSKAEAVTAAGMSFTASFLSVACYSFHCRGRHL